MFSVAILARVGQIRNGRAGSRHRMGTIVRSAARTMNMAELRLSRALVTAATVSLIVLIAQWLPVSANAGDPLIDALGSVRSTLDMHGISLGLQSTDEVFGNPNGGRAQGATFYGQTALGLGIDLDKAISLEGGIFNVSAYQTYGHGISASKIDNLSLVRTSRLRGRLGCSSFGISRASLVARLMCDSDSLPPTKSS
jgi:carbohydrate-selective porin OprB